MLSLDIEENNINMLKHDKNTNYNNESMCLRYIRKKYNCLIIYCLLLIVFLQTLQQIITKLDSNSFNTLLKLFSNTSHNIVNTTQIN